MEKVTITQVKKAIRVNGIWKGYLAGNKVNPYHIKEGWCLGSYHEFTSELELQQTISNFMFYLAPELGNRTAFYEDHKQNGGHKNGKRL